MREILFRGKRIDNGEWVYGYYCGPVGIDASNEICDINDLTGSRLDVDPDTVGQYTGLTDKKGRKIFEGDVIRHAERCDYNCWEESLEHPEAYDDEEYDPDFRYSVVKWFGENEYPAFDIDPSDFECNGLSGLLADDDFVFEIIGNIHDNPDMVEVQAK